MSGKTTSESEKKNYELPPGAMPLRFGLEEAQEAYDRYGSNCGPGAIAGVCGFTPIEVLKVMPEFEKRRATTEIMLVDALTALGVKWRELERNSDLEYGLCRVQWNGPWIDDPDPYEKLRHSHWIGLCKKGGRFWHFDINAISVGGWLSYEEWETYLRPWLLRNAEPEAYGDWWISEVYEVTRP